MQTKIIPIFFLITTLLFLSGCNLSSSGNADGQLDVTQAYQTIQARLTEAVEQTPQPPTETSLPDMALITATPGMTAAPEQPTATSAPAEPTATFLPTYTPTPATRCDQAEAAYPSIDITIPDDTEIPAGNTFTKVWRVVNTGTCNWTADYAAVFISGDQMGAPEFVYIDQPVAPGQSVDIAVNMTAPLDPGTYRSDWMLQNASGEQFGIGPNGSNPFWVQIVVTASEPVTPTATPVPEPEPLLSGPVTLNVNDNVDLDTLQLNAPGADLSYQQITLDENVSHMLFPLDGASIGLVGSAQPTYAQCQGSGQSTEAINLGDYAAGTYFCYITNGGLLGWARLDGLDTANGILNLTILTWSTP